MRRPSGENAAEPQGASSWPESTASCLAVAASQMRAVWSAEAVTMRRPSGENAAPVDDIVVAGEDGDRLGRGGVPDARRLVVGGGDDAPPVGRERGGVDLITMT